MEIKVDTQNCNFKKSFNGLEGGDSRINLTFELPKLTSVQSRNIYKNNLKQSIQNELSKFEWLICGKVQIEVNWLLNSVMRQETDKIGDLDNITKPIIDSLSGTNGIIIDDSQINSININWTTKRDLDEYSIVYLYIYFFNEWTVRKKNLYFLECSKTMYTPLNFNINNRDELINIKLYLNYQKKKRKFIHMAKVPNVGSERYLVHSEYDFHITRLNNFNHQVLKTKYFNNLLFKNGITFKYLINYLRSSKSANK